MILWGGETGAGQSVIRGQFLRLHRAVVVALHCLAWSSTGRSNPGHEEALRFDHWMTTSPLRVTTQDASIAYGQELFNAKGLTELRVISYPVLLLKTVLHAFKFHCLHQQRTIVAGAEHSSY